MKQKNSGKIDRRIQRTHQLLFEALIELVLEKGYDKITVQDITDRANVARTTFYLHFKDKEELLMNGIKTIFEEYLEKVVGDLSQDDESGYDNLIKVADNPKDFEHIAKYADFYRIMLGPQGSAVFVHSFRNYLRDVFQEQLLPLLKPANSEPKMPIDLITTASVNTQIGIYIWWLQNDLQPPPQVMAQWSSMLMEKGFSWSLGMELGQSIFEDVSPSE